MELHELNRMFDQLAPSRPQEEAVLDRLLRQEKEDKPVKKIKTLTVLGLATALMVISCAAAGITGLDQRLMEYFGAKPGQEKQLSAAVVTVEPVIHSYSSGWTVQVGQVLADRYTVTAVLDFTAPEDIDLAALVAEHGEFTLLADYQVEDQEGNLLGSSLYLGGPFIIGAKDERAFTSYKGRMEHHGDGVGDFQILDSSRLEQGHISALWTYRNDMRTADLDENNLSLMSMTEDEMLGARLRLSPKALLFSDVDKVLYVRGEEQAWTYQITLPETDPGRLYIMDEPIRIESTEQELKRIYLSPMELAYDTYYFRGQKELYAFPNQSKDYTINLSDGSIISMEDGIGKTGFHMEEDNGDNWEINHIRLHPTELVDLEQVVSVTMFGQTYALK